MLGGHYIYTVVDTKLFPIDEKPKGPEEHRSFLSYF